MFALVSDPGGTSAPGHYRRLTRPPSFRQRRLAARNGFRGSMARLSSSLSTLRTAGRPDGTQDSFPVAGHALPGGIGYPQGSSERFQSCILHLVLLSQALPGATKMPSWQRSSPVDRSFLSVGGLRRSRGPVPTANAILAGSLHLPLALGQPRRAHLRRRLRSYALGPPAQRFAASRPPPRTEREQTTGAGVDSPPRNRSA
jgi:hypothetical protein